MVSAFRPEQPIALSFHEKNLKNKAIDPLFGIIRKDMLIFEDKITTK
jgi:hypothetical protein